MNGIVIYKSKTGFTKKYAQWIAAALSCKAVPIDGAKEIDLAAYDAVVFGGWVFAGAVQGLKEFKEKLMSFNGRKAVFAVGSAANTPEAVEGLNACFTEDERKNIGTFYMQGGLDYSNMGFAHKMMMKMMCSMMKKQHGAASTEYKTISESFDATDKNIIRPIIDYITLQI